MITVLKGSPQYSIDNNGFMTITTTWMVMPDSTTDGTSAVDWLAFETKVEEWAGEIGDEYKKPIIPENGKEATEYEPDENFIVSDISYSCAGGRTHYEVTFTNEQNILMMTVVGNVSTEINENNEKTKTINYIINVSKDDTSGSGIEPRLVDSGTELDWDGGKYLVSNSSYNAVSKTRYEVSITARDMSKMMIGKPSTAIDAFGQQTMSVRWRYSHDEYSQGVLPQAGDDASSFLGLTADSKYVVTEVLVEPDGVLGYIVTINAKHVSKRLVKASRRETRKSSGTGYYTESTIHYQSDEEGYNDFVGHVGEEASHFDGGSGVGYITDVSISESGRNDFDIQITTTDEPQSSTDGSSRDDLRSQIDVSMSQSEFVLDARQAGWFQGLSGEFYPINNPPTTKFSYTVSVDSLKDMYTSTGKSLSDTAIISAIKGKSLIGYDRVSGVQAYVSDSLKWLSDRERNALSSLKDVHSIRMEGFVYAQPTMTKEGENLRNMLFEEFKRHEHCPIDVSTSDADTDTDNNRDKPLDKKFLTYKIQFMDVTVSKYYKGKATSILRKDFKYYYRQAIRYIDSDSFTSYKGAGISLNEVKDEDGNVYTQVTCNIKALLRSNGKDIKWNEGYDDSHVE